MDPLFYNSRPPSRLSATITNGYDPPPSSIGLIGNGTADGHHVVPSLRKRSLERQDTLYDDEAYDDEVDQADHLTYYDACQDAAAAADDQHRLWDAGGRGTSMTKILPRIPIKHSGSCNDDLVYKPAAATAIAFHQAPAPYVGSYGGGAVQLPPTPMCAALLAGATLVGSAKKQRLLPQPLKPHPVPVHPRLLPNMPSPTVQRRAEPEFDHVRTIYIYVYTRI